MEAPKILVVDDDQDIVELLSYNLSKEGYQVQGTTSSLEAIQLMIEFRPDVMIVDIMMPGMNGFELCHEIRDSDFGNRVSIFFITAGDSYLHHAAIENGGDDFIQKFAGLRTLINRINIVLKRKFKISKRERIVKLGRWVLDRDFQTISNQPREYKLEENEFELIYFLAQNSKRAVPINVLTDVVNSLAVFRSKQSIIQMLEALGRKLGNGFIEFRPPNWVRLNV